MVDPRGIRVSPRGRFWTMCAVAAVAQAIVLVVLVGNSFFVAEDLYLGGYLAGLPWSFETLARPTFGHLMPGFIAAWKAVASIGHLSWPLAGTIIILLNTILFVGTVRLLVALHGKRWWTPLLALAASLSLALLSCVLWWGAALSPGMGTIAAVWLWDSAVRYLRERTWWRLLPVALTMALAMSFGERQVLTPVFVLAFVVMVGVGERTTLRERWKLALRGWPVWVTMAAVSGAFLAVYVSGDYSEDGTTASTQAMAAVGYLARGIVDGFVPAMMGVLPGVAPAALGWLATIIVAAFALVTGVRDVRARWAWSWLLLAFVVSQLPVAIARVGLIGVDAAVYMVRYYTDVTLLFWLAVSVALAGLARRASVSARRVLLVAGASVGVAASAMWVWSAATMSARWPGSDAKALFSQLVDPDSPLSAALDADDAAMLDIPVPRHIVDQGMYPWNMPDRIYPWLRPGTKLTSIVEGSLVLGEDGSAVAPTLRTLRGKTARGPVDFMGAGCAQAGGPPLEILRGDLSARYLGALVRTRLVADGPSEVRLLSDRPDGSTWALSDIAEQSSLLPGGASTLVVPIAPVDATAVAIRVESGAPVCVRSADLVRPVYR